MLDDLKKFRPAIVDELRSVLSDTKTDINKWGPDIRDRILEYTLRGKMIRGSLVFIGAELSGKSGANYAALAKTAVAMELMQSFLLIHDDIMDNDDIRRGKPAVHAQYRNLAVQQQWNDANHSGISMGICAGDVAGFWAMAVLAGLDLPEKVYRLVLQTMTREIILVGTAQMQDVAHGVSPDEPSLEAIMSVYRYKTGRYTFSLPLMLGWIIAGGNSELLDDLASLGEVMGIIFQIRDDYLGLFGNTDETGKPITSDVSENKKTLYRRFLLESISRDDDNHDNNDIPAMFGNEDVSVDDVMIIRAACDKFAVITQVDELVDQAIEDAKGFVNRLFTNDEQKDRLLGFVDYLASRSG
ncbi:MAG: polyprenyl synthetase family protein [Spirochaetaceae bacterium]|nr:MAG: polyprenyl synthetase family protein [Spirochaetaceae bacterium]